MLYALESYPFSENALFSVFKNIWELEHQFYKETKICAERIHCQSVCLKISNSNAVDVVII